jgi:hypothetical protein
MPAEALHAVLVARQYRYINYYTTKCDRTGWSKGDALDLCSVRISAGLPTILNEVSRGSPQSRNTPRRYIG